MRDTVVDKRIVTVPSIRPNLLCPKTQIEQVCHHQTTTSSPSSSSSTSLSYLCSTTTNDSQNKKLEEKINERFNDEEEIKNSTKNRSNSFGHIQKGKSKEEHSLIHQNTENNELPTTSSPPTWTATFAQSLQIRSSSTRRRIRSPRPPAKHILILKRKFVCF
ncbi:unnamed protein product [Meloidogyne enterolobii]|uniref:Uncharacterized protein n=1 Tax=Meloidogyne enterolobii TaxID=390850 RepID=A0ACB0Y4R0_MELEN